jgi:hypothetical protein
LGVTTSQSSPGCLCVYGRCTNLKNGFELFCVDQSTQSAVRGVKRTITPGQAAPNVTYALTALTRLTAILSSQIRIFPEI